jgi:hypothetical protein
MSMTSELANNLFITENADNCGCLRVAFLLYLGFALFERGGWGLPPLFCFFCQLNLDISHHRTFVPDNCSHSTREQNCW